jgi:hypothetical protein
VSGEPARAGKLHLLPRSGERPRTRPTMPHQQLDRIAPVAIQEEHGQRMARLEGVRTGRSGVSLPSLPESRAVHLDPELARGPVEALLIGTEFAHLHGTADGSLRVTLPPAVAVEPINKGWRISASSVAPIRPAYGRSLRP